LPLEGAQRPQDPAQQSREHEQHDAGDAGEPADQIPPERTLSLEVGYERDRDAERVGLDAAIVEFPGNAHQERFERRKALRLQGYVALLTGCGQLLDRQLPAQHRKGLPQHAPLVVPYDAIKPRIGYLELRVDELGRQDEVALQIRVREPDEPEQLDFE